MSKYATPNYILTNEEKLSVYEPSEDTFLLLDALEKDAELIEKQRPTICVEIGCGSGLASIFVAKYLQRGALILCTDINPVALRVSQRNADLNNLRRNCIEFLRTDTLDAIEYRLQNKIDLLLFNPPYVPSDEPLRPEDMLAHAYAGGENGTRCLTKLIPKIHELLSPDGLFYVIALSSNNVSNLVSVDPRIRCTISLERKCGIERLFVLRYSKN